MIWILRNLNEWNWEMFKAGKLIDTSIRGNEFVDDYLIVFINAV